MSKEDWQQNTLPEIFKNEWPSDVVSVLDVGCGLALKSKYIPAQIRVGVDIHPEYFRHVESEVPYVAVVYDIRRLSQIFLDKSFDVVIATDVVEHLEKQDAIRLMEDCERIARKAVVIETPKGFIPQNIDILGHGGDEYQTHRSGWSAEEFQERGYNVKIRPYTMTDAKRHTDLEVDPHIELIDAIKHV